MENTLNKRQLATTEVLMIVMASVAAFMLMIATFGQFALAAGGTFIGNGASSLLSDMGIVIALATIVVGIINIIKGATSRAIIVFVIGGMLAAVAISGGSILGSIGKAIFGIFNWS